MTAIIFRLLRICVAIYFIIATYGILTAPYLDCYSVADVVINTLIVLYCLFYTKLKILFIKRVKINRK